ncbi:DUF6371 domain-containing protein [Sphingobium fluviale]|uniref:DUF6371 domain-containing protein n=1 Tax=Sphingobium fluviale TaxID=2506423 RepID=A0A4Q1KG51_9SPHN|nr:DUF6371 domain-containing protein [Sphingobium fluviale]RXR27591.1 hypothetical protein EQG66_12000 [Sphingobium fluviale]
MIDYIYSKSPTIDERVALGRERNSTTDLGIIPFPLRWDPEWLFDNFARGAKAPVSRHLSDGYRFTSLYCYRDAGGAIIAGAVRLDHPEKGKQVLPVRSTGAIGCSPMLEVKALEPPRPLYGLDLLAKRPDAPILLVEGEKAADAARRIFPDFVAMTWSGGCKAVGKADFRPCAGRTIVLWPDNDPGGLSVIPKLGGLLHAVGAASFQVVKIPPCFPQKWDLADPIPSEAHG